MPTNKFFSAERTALRARRHCTKHSTVLAAFVKSLAITKVRGPASRSAWLYWCESLFNLHVHPLLFIMRVDVSTAHTLFITPSFQ